MWHEKCPRSECHYGSEKHIRCFSFHSRATDQNLIFNKTFGTLDSRQYCVSIRLILGLDRWADARGQVGDPRRRGRTDEKSEKVRGIFQKEKWNIIFFGRWRDFFSKKETFPNPFPTGFYWVINMITLTSRKKAEARYGCWWTDPSTFDIDVTETTRIFRLNETIVIRFPFSNPERERLI